MLYFLFGKSRLWFGKHVPVEAISQYASIQTAPQCNQVNDFFLEEVGDVRLNSCRENTDADVILVVPKESGIHTIDVIQPFMVDGRWGLGFHNNAMRNQADVLFQLTVVSVEGVVEQLIQHNIPVKDICIYSHKGKEAKTLADLMGLPKLPTMTRFPINHYYQKKVTQFALTAAATPSAATTSNATTRTLTRAGEEEKEAPPDEFDFSAFFEDDDHEDGGPPRKKQKQAPV
eukprot:TRINITY_DN66941_c2_g13_i1.p1 TRINITY_DN66941_c2_g13~~TRINITY_DN66941_c2_g13_i1.p1  ORF type:complete len:231 (-),score=17.64 TRINITY_DN66941_c2_g13_i1:101-793(-)